MKKRIYMSLLLMVLLFTAGAQTLNDEALLERIGVDAAVIERIHEMNMEDFRSARAAGADQRILQARLEKLLLNPEPDMIQVEALLKEAMELKLQEELRKIERSREMRKLLGEEQWMQLLRYRREHRERIEARNGGLPADNEPAETRESQETRDSGSIGSGDAAAGSGSGRK
jgi:hypothetical protein